MPVENRWEPLGDVAEEMCCDHGSAFADVFYLLGIAAEWSRSKRDARASQGPAVANIKWSVTWVCHSVA